MPVDWSIADPKQGFDYLQSLQAIGQSQAQALQNQTNQYKLRQQQRQDEIRPLIAARIGQGDYTGAQQQAVSVGADDLAGTIGGLHDQHFKDLAVQNEARGTVAYTLAQIKDPAQRAQAYAAAVPHLKATGLTDAELANPDLSDTALQQHIAEAQGIDAIIKQKQQEREAAQRDRELGQGDQRIDLARQGQTLDQQKFEYEQHKPVSTAFGTSLVDPTTGRVVYDGSGGLTGGGGDTSRLINSAAGGGYVPDNVQTLGQFVQFGKALNARGAKSSAAGTYQITGSTMAQFAPQVLGPNWQSQPFNADSQEKVGEAIFNWAKAQPNPAAALRGRWVSLSPQAAAQAVQGSWAQARNVIAAGESGGSSRGAGGLGSDAIDRMATDYNRTHKIPPGFAKNPAAVAAIQNRAAQQLHEQGGNASTSLADTASVHADTAGLAALQRRATTMNASETAAQANAHLVLQLAPAVGNGNVPVFNAWKNAAGRNTGDPNISKLNAAVETFANEYATVMGKGVPTDGLRAHAHEMINTSQSPKQLQGVVATLMKDMANQRAGFAQERQETLTRIGSGGGRPGAAPVRVGSRAEAMKLPPGTHFQAPDGRVFVR